LERRVGQLVGRRDRHIGTLFVASEHVHVRAASVDDVENVLDLLAQAAAWTAVRGYPNWPPRFSPRFIASSARNGELFVAEFDGAVNATLTLQWHDPRFWGDLPAVADGDAGYVHRLAVRRSRAGHGLGYRLLDWADLQVRANGGSWLRLDVVTENGPLRRYYEAAGFVHRDDVEGMHVSPDGTTTPWRTSLYERSCHRDDTAREVRRTLRQ
jgi:GNAT superfamily N-acetyltransferase